MPARYALHPDLGVVVTRFQGAVTDEEFVGLYRALLADPLYREGTNELADLREIASFAITASALREVEAWTRRRYSGATTSFRTAIVAPSDLSFGIGRMYEVFAADGPEAVSVFRGAQMALRWLGLQDMDLAGLHDAD